MGKSPLLGQVLAVMAWVMIGSPGPALARDARVVKVAVAANFADPIKEIAARFERGTGHRLVISFGSTGQFYAQIAQGAPFEVLLAADASTPAKAVAAGFGVAGTSFTYAVGKLVLFSRTDGLVSGEATLRAARFDKLAIANPATAPYGAAAVEVMRNLGVYSLLQARVVQGNSIAQAFQFVDTGNAEIGFVALSQVALVTGGSRWTVPAHLHAPILQYAVLLKAGADSEYARALLAFLKGTDAKAIIEKFGYDTVQ
jgi:molybdate transport system substrate-binding protein